MDTINRRIISPRTVMERTGFGRTSLWRKGRNPEDDFPAAVQVSDNKIGWYEDEIAAWLESRPRLTSKIEEAA